MIVFAWSGFLQYAARCVGAFVKATDENVVVVATRPRVPIEGMEKLCGCPVHWIDGGVGVEERWTEDVDTLIVSGWGIPAFNQLADDVRRRGGRVICMVDNNFVFSVKEIVKAIRFRLKLRKKYDGFFVPGKSGRRLLRFYGVPDDKIAEGLYSADESLFTPGLPLSKREKMIIYVGQLCDRKNVKRMCEAFEMAKVKGVGVGRWELHLYGAGPLKEELTQTIQNSKTQTIHIHDFLQPEELAAKYREARVFCLPSVEEHWGLVVHEAALSGCFLLLSDVVGAAEDFATKENAALFGAEDLKAMTAAFKRVMTMDDEALDRAGEICVKMSKNASLDKFVQGLRMLGV